MLQEKVGEVMKSWQSVAATFLFCSSLFSGSQGTSTRPPGMVAQTDAAAAKLPPRLTINVLTQRYCKEPGSDTSDNLRMKLRLRYTNAGTRPLILYKHQNTVFREMISRNPLDAAAHRYVWDFSLTQVTGGKDSTIDGPVPNSSFAVLRPGQFFDGEAEITIFVRRGRTSKEPDGLLPGAYFLQVSVSTWPETASMAERLRKRWQGIAPLWFHDLTSEPAQFKIEKNRKVVGCSED
jgi:hypothetical protein